MNSPSQLPHDPSPHRLLSPALTIALFLALISTTAFGNDTADARRACEHQHAVRIGNAGKDVIWVPTHDKLVTAMLQAAETGPNDFVIDLGAGDGKIPIAAAKEFGASALGIEYDSEMVELAQCYVIAEQLAQQVEIRQADIFQEDFSKATVLTMYLLPELNLKLRPSLLALRPGTRIVSNRFKMGRWQPDKLISVDGVANQAYLWIVPAQIAGLWRFEAQSGRGAFRARLTQEFQQLHGSILGRAGGRIRGKLQGVEIDLLVPSRPTLRLSGHLENGEMRLIAKDVEPRIEYRGRRE